MSGRRDEYAREAVETAAGGWLDEDDAIDEAPELVDGEQDAVWVPVLAPRRPPRPFGGSDRGALGRGLDALTTTGAEPLAAPALHATGRLAGKPRGLAALIPTGPLPVVAAAPAERPAGEWDGRDRRAPVRIDGRHRVEADWLVTSTNPRVLHHAQLSDQEYAALAADDGVERDDDPEPLQLTCGRTAWAVARPNRIERAAGTRCEQCCEHLGYPTGHGSPASDPDCEPRLLLILGPMT